MVRKLGAKRVSILGEYFVNNLRLIQYRETVLDLIEGLLETNFAAIPRK